MRETTENKPDHTPEWQSALNDAAHKFVTNHKDSEVRRMYGHHFRSFVDGAVWESDRNVTDRDQFAIGFAEWTSIRYQFIPGLGRWAERNNNNATVPHFDTSDLLELYKASLTQK